PALDAVAAALDEAAAAQRDADAALAGPRLSARVVLGLPGVAVLFAYGMGIDVLATLRTSAGLAAVSAGALLYAAGALWIRTLAAHARPVATVPGLGLELIALTLSAGLPVDRARQVVAEEADAAGLAVDSAQVGPLIELAARSGAPVARLLRAEAARLRRRVAADARERAARLGVLLLLPLGVCMLPAFLLVGVAPVLVGLLTSVTPL
ncbi:MAG: putative integral rane protein, partial [Naasia sp.]|nr:putative integral rane protein [Naasia sp.]